MTDEQMAACEKFVAEGYRCCDQCGQRASNCDYAFERGFEAAQSKEMLLLNPMVKGLIEALEFVTDEDKFHLSCMPICTKALAPFQQDEK